MELKDFLKILAVIYLIIGATIGLIFLFEYLGTLYDIKWIIGVMLLLLPAVVLTSVFVAANKL